MRRRRPTRPDRRPSAERRASIPIGAAALLLALSACTAPGAPQTGSSPPPSDAPPGSAALPAGVSVDLVQYRSDRATRTLALEVHNDSTTDLRMTAAIFDSAGFAAPAEWPGSSGEVPAGVVRALRVPLADSVCDGSAPDVGTVTLSYSLPDGRTGTAAVVPTDSIASLDRIRLDDCAGQAVAAIAELTGTRIAISGTGSASVARLTVEVRPTGAAGGAHITGAASTVLLSAPDGAGWGLDLTVAGTDAPSSFELELVPNRCDPHVVAEDKVGTRLPITAVTDDGVTHTFALPLAVGLRSELLQFVGEHCGF